MAAAYKESLKASPPALLYFPFPGRGLPCRISLYAAFGETGWKNELMTFADFGAEKAKIAAGEPTVLPSGSLPQLTVTVDGKSQVFTQSHAICRWAANLARDSYPHLYPDNPSLQLAIDEAVAVCDEILLKTPHDKDAEVKKTKREEFAATGYLKNGLKMLEAKAAAVGGPFYVGSELSLADIFIAANIQMIKDGQFDHVPKEYVDQFPTLCKLVEATAAAALVKEYMAFEEKSAPAK